jgi:hypothetical protein
MNEIFVSWASPDKQTADRLVDRLTAAGLPVNEYSRRMRTGDEIRSWVSDAVEEARIVIVCLSVAALEHSGWIDHEVSLATGRLDRTHNSLERLLVIRIGEVPDDRLPGMLQPDRLNFCDMTPVPGEEQLARLVADVAAALGEEAPFVVPAALYAMTNGEFDELADLAGESAEAKARLAELCHSAGMTEPPDIWTQLRGRYGGTSEEFAPYKDGDPLIEATQAVLGAVNAGRLRERRRPLYLLWYSRAELSRDQTARDRWRRGHSVLVVDSVSTLHRAVADDLQALPRAHEASKAAVVCLPPYSRHTGRLELMIEASLAHHALLSDAFRDWRDAHELPNAFDVPSETSLRRWFRQLLYALDVSRTPVPAKVKALAGDRPPPGVPRFGSVSGE